MTETDSKQEDLRLAAEAKKDLRAFKAIYLKYVQPVYRYTLSHTGSREEAEDATAQTFLAAIESFGRYREDGRFGAWLFTIARRKAMDALRGRGKSSPLEDDFPAPEKDPLREVEQRERLAGLAKMLGRLSADEQELLRLRFAAELGFAEIAGMLKLSEDAVKKRYYRLLAQLQERMEGNHD